LIVIFANRRYLNYIEEVEEALRQNPAFIPDLQEGRINARYLYYRLLARHQHLMHKVVVFYKDNTEERLPRWMRSARTVAPWPWNIQAFMTIVWPLLTKQAKLIMWGYSTP
jgi:hypothetical protein